MINNVEMRLLRLVQCDKLFVEITIIKYQLIQLLGENTLLLKLFKYVRKCYNERIKLKIITVMLQKKIEVF